MKAEALARGLAACTAEVPGLVLRLSATPSRRGGTLPVFVGVWVYEGRASSAVAIACRGRRHSGYAHTRLRWKQSGRGCSVRGARYRFVRPCSCVLLRGLVGNLGSLGHT